MSFSVRTDKGPVRENNQDSFSYGETNGFLWAVVCDGMGGVSGGQVASEICVNTVSQRLERDLRKKMNYSSVKNVLASSLQAANAEILKKAEQDGLNGMGTTVVIAVISDGIAILAHVGDSRIYKLCSGEAECLTRDHSIVQVLIDSGKLTPELAKTHPDRNIITRAVGVGGYLEIETDVTDYSDGDILLLCTDGLTGSVESADIVNEVANGEFSEAAQRLVELALNKGATDNVTALLVTR